MPAPSFLTISIALIAGILLIILLSTRFKMHPFFSLSVAYFVTGGIGGLDVLAILTTMKEGFGKIMSSLGFIITIGTALGIVLQNNGATAAMANAILKLVGNKRSVFAISLTGFIVGLPIFCDSGYIVLNGLNKSLIRKTQTPTIIMSTALATSLYSVHCFIPPHPGITSATGTLNADFGRVIFYGFLVAIPAMLTGYWWAVWKGRSFPEVITGEENEPDATAAAKLPGTITSFVPVIVPIILIALKAILASLPGSGKPVPPVISLLGDPGIALSAGLILALCIPKKWNKNELNKLMHHGIEKAGGILIIIGAGSAFGAIIAALNLQQYLSSFTMLNALGVFFPFLIAAILKTAQGSSTVAVITTASIVLPFLSGLGLDSENGRIIAVLAMGAGSMVASHVNDSYFWVIANFSNPGLKPMLRVFSVATLLMGIAGVLSVYILSLIIL